VDAVFKNAASMGMTAARTWAHSISEQFPFQTAPGKYDEQGMQVRPDMLQHDVITAM
jgi:hypothetical protein